MRPAQLGVNPGTFASSAALAWLMSTRASGGGMDLVFADACGAEADCDWLNALFANAAMQTASTGMAANCFPARTGSVSDHAELVMHLSRCASTCGHASSCRFFDSSSGKPACVRRSSVPPSFGNQFDRHLRLRAFGCSGDPREFNKLRGRPGEESGHSAGGAGLRIRFRRRRPRRRGPHRDGTGHGKPAIELLGPGAEERVRRRLHHAFDSKGKTDFGIDRAYASARILRSQVRTSDNKPFDTKRAFARSLKTDAEPPPSRPPPSSWDNHAGGLPWPEVNGQRDRKKYPSPPANDAGGFFHVLDKISKQERDRKTMGSEKADRF
jgi:hypothetical protein